ncbi:conjugative transfer signal peptidase TraF [Mesorhizobium albiziae]|uniref:Conjugative transfer signal peptidase TraF n=1 Tax=Neomesorhizobium albiziae TaxID=335020 RepID=A0A1I4F353_9HYPH|nr:S26 family signal peptidase [Mesorhizobium albiziae]GLS32441.1 chromosome segregation protein ParM [Mesorhizobium albiziae]SFL11989.1 conjugative transfer signal peptidase TraF [Mesorhizobium albiziae]
MSRRMSIHLTGSRLRRIRARKAISIASLGAGLIGFTAFVKPSPLLVWNASASAPVGLYRIGFVTPARGDLALVRPPESVAAFADKRGYLPRTVPLAKHVAALPGEHVCAFNEAIIIGGEIVARRLEADRQGRPLPWWNECRALADDEAFLLGADAPGSFDSRYFGPVPVANVIGRLVPLWSE